MNGVFMPRPDQSVYQYFYDKEFITPKEMASLIVGFDPRKNRITTSNTPFKNIYDSIRNNIKNGNIEYKGIMLKDSQIETKMLFRWAVNQYPDFKNQLPVALAEHIGIASLGGFSTQITGKIIPSYDSSESRKLAEDNLDLEIRVLELEEENEKLRKAEQIRNDARSKGGKNSKGVKKTKRLLISE